MLCTAILPAVSTHLLFVVLILFPLQYITHTHTHTHIHTYTHTHTHTLTHSSIFILKKEALPFPWPASSAPLIPASIHGPFTLIMSLESLRFLGLFHGTMQNQFMYH